MLHRWTGCDGSAACSVRHDEVEGGFAHTFAKDVEEQLHIFGNMRRLPLDSILVVMLFASDDEPIPGDGPVNVHDIARDMLHGGLDKRPVSRPATLPPRGLGV